MKCSCGDELPIVSYGKVRCESCNSVNDVPLPQELKQEVRVSAPKPASPKQKPIKSHSSKENKSFWYWCGYHKKWITVILWLLLLVPFLYYLL